MIRSSSAVPDVDAVEGRSEPCPPRGVEAHPPEVIAREARVHRGEGVEEGSCPRVELVDSVLVLHAHGVDPTGGRPVDGPYVVHRGQVPGPGSRIIPIHAWTRAPVRAAMANPELRGAIVEDREDVGLLQRAAGRGVRERVPRRPVEMEHDAAS